MKKEFFKVEDGSSEYCAVHYLKDHVLEQYEGRVYYPVIMSDGGQPLYASDSEGYSKLYKEANEDCGVLFEFYLTWRGYWEDRIYFKGDEYWGEEIRMMADLWDSIFIFLSGDQ